MTEKDMEQLLRELLEECDNEKFVDSVESFEAYKGPELAKHGLVVIDTDGSWFFITIEKVI